MKLNRIDLFAPTYSQYGVLDLLTKDLFQALTRQGIECRVLKAIKEHPQAFLDQIFSNPPDCTLSFNGLLPDNQGRFLADLTNIPHVACLVEAPHYFFTLTQSALNIITCVDPFFCKIFKDFNFPNTLWVPHGVDKELTPNSEKPLYDVVLFASGVDPDVIQKRWMTLYPPSICQVLQDAAEQSLRSSTSYIETFTQSFNALMQRAPIDPRQFSYVDLLEDLELYIRAKDKVELLKHLDASVHVFGPPHKGEEWKKHLVSSPAKVTFHPEVSYEQSLQILRQSKIAIASTPTRASHPTIFAGLAAGAAVLTTEHEWLRHSFKEGELLFYRPSLWKEANDTLQNYLQEDSKRQELVQKGRQIVMQQHTWDQRASKLVEELPPILQTIKEKLGL